ncbi:5-oxoprolinase subunit PxpB [uncultured Lacinutrix sp.]|uniref:5-oxoprolinase subunit PxpB n=1 Tax=uncultured Lacinutrix sp. TaxID=574032 RepID=UPI0026200258|nr:5-oxoprolinase subunit PxpB [uncultured Lacinutrix sp.]
MNYDLQYKQYGNQALLIEWPEKINEAILNDILSFKNKIESEQAIKIEDLIIGYNSLTIIYNNSVLNFQEEIARLKATYIKLDLRLDKKTKTWLIPVCYDEEFGIDLKQISHDKNRPIEEIIDVHSKTIYTIYFIGFLPGFLYLGVLNRKIHSNRKNTPSLTVSKGSVGIGGSQTGIYPSESAGGWNIIGKTPISFFDVSKQEPCFAKSGDKIHFFSITKKEYYFLEESIKNGLYELKCIEND